MRLPEPPEGILDPQNPWHLPMPKSPGLWGTLKARLTGRPNEYGDYSSYVNITEADADRLIANMKKDPRGYPQLDQTSGTPAQWMERQRIYQEWLVEEYLERPFREETDNKIEEAAIERRLNEIQEEKKKKVEQAVELTNEVVEETVLEEPEEQPDVPMVVPTTELIPSPKKPEQEEQKPEKTRKKRSSLLGSMLKTFTRMENHFQKLIELTESSEADMVVISDAFKIQSDALTRGFQETTTLVTRVTQAVDLQSSTMVRIAKGKKDLDQKRLDAQESLNEEVALEQQQSSSGNAKAEDIGKGSGPGGGVGGSIAKVLGGAVIGKVLAGKGLKLAKGIGGKTASKISGKVLEKALGKETAEAVLKNAGREAAETGVEKGAAKLIGKRIPLVGLGIGTFLALERAAKGDFLGAGLELASGAASTIPGGGTAASLGIDAALMARDSGMLPFEKGGLTQKSTFSTKRPGVTDLSPDLFKKMYQYEIDYEARNKIKFGRLYAEGYKKYFENPSITGVLTRLLGPVIDFFKNLMKGLGNIIRNLPNPFAGPVEEFESTGGQRIKRSEFGRGFGVRDGLGSGASATGHTGLDVGMPSGTPLSIVPPGVVHFTATGYNGGYGNLVVVKLDDGRFVKLNHLSQINVKVGDRVGEGSGENGAIKVVGKVGSTGLSTGPHMHVDLGSGFDKNTYFTTGLVDPSGFIEGGGIVKGGNVRTPNKKEPEVPEINETEKGSNNQWWDPLKIIPDSKKRAKGGPVSAGTPYFVGESGPELFVPKESGFVMNNQQTAGLLDFLPNTGRVMAPKGEQFSGQQTTVQKFLGITVPGSERFTTYGQGDIERYNRAKPTRPLVPGQAMYRSPDGRSQYTAPTTRTQSASETGVPLSPERRRERALRDSIDAARAVQKIPGANSVGGGLLQDTINLGEQELKNQLEMERLINKVNTSSAKQIDKLVAMAPLEEQMTTSVQVIRVNNTNTIPIAAPEDTSDGAASAGNIFKDLHLASIS